VEEERARSIDDFGWHGLPTCPERAEEVFLEKHHDLEESTGGYAFESLDAARAFVLDVCAGLAETDERAAGRPLPLRVLQLDDVRSKGSYNPKTREMRLRLLVTFSALHEIAHWLAPPPEWETLSEAESKRTQHFKPWREAQLMLVSRFLDESYATELASAYAEAEQEAPGGVFECDGPLRD
jgi:hypothetical protein